jgi:ABC-type polysaccharide transport system permease subunit
MSLAAACRNEVYSMKKTDKTAPKKHNKRENRELTLMAVPAAVWYVLFCYLPLFGIAFAFKQFTPVPGESLFTNLFVNSPWVGLKNFSFLIRSSQMPQIMFNTLFYNLIFLAAGIVLPVLLAVFLTEIHNKRFSGVVQTVMILPYFLSWVIVGYCLYGFLATDEGAGQPCAPSAGEGGCAVVSVSAVLESDPDPDRDLEIRWLFHDDLPERHHSHRPVSV